MSDVVPFLKAVAAARNQPLQSALPQIATAPATSPWSPKPEVEQAPPPPAPAIAEAPAIDLAAITAQAIDDGRAEGMRETEALRGKLVQLIEELDKAREAFAVPATEMIADAATAVIESWVGATDRKQLFAPIIGAWISSGAKGGSARCHPDDAQLLREAIGEAGLEVIPDPALRSGDLAIADATRELSHAWEPRLREIREAIAGALSE